MHAAARGNRLQPWAEVGLQPAQHQLATLRIQLAHFPHVARHVAFTDASCCDGLTQSRRVWAAILSNIKPAEPGAAGAFCVPKAMSAHSNGPWRGSPNAPVLRPGVTRFSQSGSNAWGAPAVTTTSSQLQ